MRIYSSREPVKGRGTINGGEKEIIQHGSAFYLSVSDAHTHSETIFENLRDGHYWRENFAFFEYHEFTNGTGIFN